MNSQKRGIAADKDFLDPGKMPILISRFFKEAQAEYSKLQN